MIRKWILMRRTKKVGKSLASTCGILQSLTEGQGEPASVRIEVIKVGGQGESARARVGAMIDGKPYELIFQRIQEVQDDQR